jgi:hypothetical protein
MCCPIPSNEAFEKMREQVEKLEAVVKKSREWMEQNMKTEAEYELRERERKPAERIVSLILIL